MKTLNDFKALEVKNPIAIFGGNSQVDDDNGTTEKKKRKLTGNGGDSHTGD